MTPVFHAPKTTIKPYVWVREFGDLSGALLLGSSSGVRSLVGNATVALSIGIVDLVLCVLIEK